MSNTSKTLAWTIRITLVLVTLTLVACSSQNDQQMVQTARDYLGEHNVREAALELRDALQKNPDNAEARYLLGQINLDIGDSATAEKEFRRAREAGWQEEEAQIGLARAMINANRFQALLDEVEVKDTYPPTARANLYGLYAAAQAGLGELDQAAATLATGAEIDANAFQLLKTTIQLRLASGDLDGAASTLERALSAHPDNPELLLLSAITAIQANDQPGAMAAYRKVIDHEPPKLITANGRKARLGLARLEILDKNIDQAQATLAPLVEIDANDPETAYLVGMLAFAQGDYDRAEESLFKVIKKAPEHSQTQLLLGTVSYAQQDYEQAAYYIAKYVSAVPGNLDARKLLGRTYMMLGQQDEAQATMQQALEEGTEDAELLALVGLSQLQGGDTASGIEGLEKAVKAAPDSTTLRGELAKAYISAGETDRAIRELESLLEAGGEGQRMETLLVLAHLRTGNFEQAIDVALGMLARNPEDPAVLTLVGDVFTASDNKPEARKYYSKALQLSPGYVPATMSLARLEELEDNPVEAAALYQGIKDTESTAPLLALARLAETQGKKEEMADWLEQAREHAPRDIKPRVMLAEHYLREKQPEKAGIVVQEALKIAPKQRNVLALQGRVLIAGQRYNEALPLLRELVTRAPDSVLARVLLGETYLRLGQTKDARRELEFALEKQPQYLPALVLMVKVELLSDHDEQALNYARQIQDIQPDMGIGYELAGDARVAGGDYAEAGIVFAKAWDLEPSAKLTLKLAEALKRSGKPEETTVTLLAWLSDYPDDARVRQFLGITYQDMGQNDKAIEAYNKVLSVQPDNVVALNNLAWLYSLSSDPRALGLAERAYQANPDGAGIQDTYGWILVQQGQADKGRGLLKQAMEKLSGVPEVRYHYAVALLQSGEEEEARQMLKKLLQEDKSFVGREDAQQLLE